MGGDSSSATRIASRRESQKASVGNALPRFCFKFSGPGLAFFESLGNASLVSKSAINPRENRSLSPNRGWRVAISARGVERFGGNLAETLGFSRCERVGCARPDSIGESYRESYIGHGCDFSVEKPRIRCDFSAKSGVGVAFSATGLLRSQRGQLAKRAVALRSQRGQPGGCSDELAENRHFPGFRRKSCR